MLAKGARKRHARTLFTVARGKDRRFSEHLADRLAEREKEVHRKRGRESGGRLARQKGNRCFCVKCPVTSP